MAGELELIVTHVGADFDAVASMLAARKLHPEARFFLPGSCEESVRRMLDDGLVELPALKHRQVEPERLRRVVLCDIRQRHRIGVVARWLEEHPDIEVLAYDHHSESPEDLRVAGGIVDPAAGSTSTLLAEELRRRELPPTPTEATVMLMGIYEDTGSLIYPTTTPRDLTAAAWLLALGGELGAVKRYALHRLDAEHLELLHRMTRALETRSIHGHRVGCIALELGSYVEELAPLVNRCLEIFELPLLFLLAGEGDGVTLIARGQVEGLHLGEFLETFARRDGGGGGHPTAASARLKGVTALEIRERLWRALEERLPPAARAADLMTAGFYILPAGTTVAEAKAQLNRRRINAAPVAAPVGEGAAEGEGRVAGGVTRQILDAALQHGLGERPVERVMQRELAWVAPEAPAQEIARLMTTLHPRFVLVGDRAAARPLGLVTRTQVLTHLHGRLTGEEGEEGDLERHSRAQGRRHRQVKDLLRRGLPESLKRRVAAAAEISRARGVPVYLVGGLVRDLLLERENRDLDLVVEGDGIAFARLLAERLGGRVRAHHAFMTAVVVDGEGFHIDVATARSEQYRAPAALPEVEVSPLRQDLYRRDFTINTLAVRLGPEGPPTLIDYFGGRRDLNEGVLRVLHSLSFIDDPTRVLRAVRLEQRLGFHLSPETLRLVEVALEEGIFERLSGSRLREELILLLDDPATALGGLRRLAELGVLAVLHPRLELDAAAAERLRRALAAWDWYRLEGVEEPRVSLWRLLLATLAAGLDAGERRDLAQRLMLAGEDERFLIAYRERLAGARAVLDETDARPHRVADALAPLSGEELLLLMAARGEGHRAWVRRYLTEMLPFRLTIRGADLLARGAAPGPALGQALAATRRARLDGEIGAAQELEHALAFLAVNP